MPKIDKKLFSKQEMNKQRLEDKLRETITLESRVGTETKRFKIVDKIAVIPKVLIGKLSLEI